MVRCWLLLIFFKTKNIFFNKNILKNKKKLFLNGLLLASNRPYKKKQIFFVFLYLVVCRL